jgi:hypothetical protein
MFYETYILYNTYVNIWGEVEGRGGGGVGGGEGEGRGGGRMAVYQM